jgi:ribonuclease D
MRLFLKKCVEVGYNIPMHSYSLPAPSLINSQPKLQRLVNVLSKQPLVAVDTEANSLFAYNEKVCLIQFSIPGKDYLVDPLVLQDLSLLNDFFNDPKIEKIFHAAEYDILMLKQDYQFSFKSLFDTMLAARILGWKNTGLSSILKSHFGVNVNKKYQRANWGRRPLPKEMLAYAQLDTHYLIPLRDQMKAELIAVDRMPLAEEDFRRVCEVKPNNSLNKRIDPWRINGAKDLSKQQVAVLHELCKFRDQKARSLDRPLFKVIGDNSLVNIAHATPESFKELERVPGVSQKQVNWIGNGLLSAVQRGLKKKPPPKPVRKRRDIAYFDRVESLRSWRKATARKYNVPSDVVLPKDLLYTLADRELKKRSEVNRVLKSVPWRRKQFGDEIFRLLTASDI